MTAKQTTSASLVGLLAVASPVLAEEPVSDADVQPPGEVQPKRLELMPKREPTGTFEIGAGYSTDEGFLVGMQIAQSRLFGTDKALTMRGLISRRRHESLVRYEDPTFFDVLQLRGDLYSRRKLYEGFTRQAAGGALSLGRRIAPNLDVFVGYKLEHVENEYDVSTLYRATSPREDRWAGGLVGALKTGINYSTIAAGDSYDPRRGTIVGASLERADRDLGSSIEYLRTDAWFGHHQPLGPFTLHVAGKLSSISEGVPMSERLQLDGSTDVRGYAPGSVMPTGANLMWTTRTELETPTVADLSLSGFFDAGAMYAAGARETLGSVGIGLVWRSPIGPLRFDWAVPLTGEDRGVRFIFGVGGMF